ncbi:MAG: glycosyltransferase [Bacteroidetes bacterium]|nr:glycosyltransferase [Bacteroidota bacterium]
MSNKLKIAILSPFYPLRGGIAQFADNLANELEKNHEVLRVNFKRQYPRFLFPGKSQEVSKIDQNLEKSEPLIDSIGWFSFGRTAKVLNTFEPDLVITAYWMPLMLVAYSRIIKKLKSKDIRKVILIHNFISHQKKPFEKSLILKFIKKNDKIIALSETVANQIQKEAPKPAIKVLHHPVYNQFGDLLPRTTSEETLLLPKNKKVVLFFGLVREYKGLLDLITAFEQLADDYFLLIAGECYGSTEVYNQALSKLSKGKYRWDNQFVPDEQVRLYFSVADVCVLPYRSATQSGVTAVSHHFNLPVIATNVGGVHESVQHKKNGILVEPERPDQLQKAIEDYFDKNMKPGFVASLTADPPPNWKDFSSAIVKFSMD